MNFPDELGMIFLYIFAYGISDFIVKRYMISNTSYLLYYICMGFTGVIILNVFGTPALKQHQTNKHPTSISYV